VKEHSLSVTDYFPANSQAGKRSVELSLLAFWLSIAILLVLTNHLAVLGRPFDYIGRGAWVSAHFSTMARAFVENGVVALGGVPIQNNLPLGLEPDAYIHWPPLFPLMLSIVFRIFGESEWTAHGLMLVLLFANSLALFVLVKECCGSRVGYLAVFASLTIPVAIIYGRVVLHLHLAMFCMLLALLGFVKATAAASLHRGWAMFGAASLILAVLTSWEPLLACLGLLAVAMWQRRRLHIRLALLYLSISVAVCVGTITIYLYNSPHLAIHLISHVLHRTGLPPSWSDIFFRIGLRILSLTDLPSKSGQFRIHSEYHKESTLLQHSIPEPSYLHPLVGQLVSQLELIGLLAFIAVVGVLATGWARRHSDCDGRGALLFGGLMAPWLLWSTIMSKHIYIHEYEVLLAVPAASLALGLSMVTLLKLPGLLHTYRRFERYWFAPILVHWIVLILLPAVMLLPLIREVKNRLSDPGHEAPIITYARDIEENTEPGAVVMISDPSMVPVYYSKRHVLRGVDNDLIVDKAMGRTVEVFPGSPVYLALHPESLQEFSQSLRRYRVIKQSTHLVLLAVSEASPNIGTP
jgi:4-amino-4-deoxy-L-arabinose transferase-like glycosyltransferase